jgi:hypothetical protein
MFENTQKMNPDQLKEVLKRRAREEGIDLLDPRNQYTFWSENGIWSEGARHLLFEGIAADSLERQRKLRECTMKTAGSRMMILDALQDQIEIVPALEVRADFVR